MTLGEWLAAKESGGGAAPSPPPAAPPRLEMNRAPELTKLVLVELLPEDSLNEGLFYWRNGLVKSFQQMPNGTIVGTVRDQRNRQFELWATVSRINDEYNLQAQCTCRGVRCSHVAAVLYASLAAKSSRTGPVVQPQKLVQPRPSPVPEPPVPEPPVPEPHPVDGWLERLIDRAAERPDRDKVLAEWPPEPGRPVNQMVAGKDTALHFLGTTETGGRLRPTLQVQLARVLKSGRLGRDRVFLAWQYASGLPENFTADDRVVLDATRELFSRKLRPIVEGRALAAAALFSALATGRCYWRDRNGPLLRCGPIRPGRLQWVPYSGGQILVATVEDPAVVVFSSVLPFYLDPARGEAGPLDLGLPPEIVATLFEGPPLGKGHREAVREAFDGPLAALNLPQPHKKFIEEVIKAKPVPRLKLMADPASANEREIAVLSFLYNRVEIDPASAQKRPRLVEGNRIFIIGRNMAQEEAAFRRLNEAGFFALDDDGDGGGGAVWSFNADSDPDSHWLAFVHRTLPVLREAGWRIETAEDFRHRVVDGGLDWRADIDAADTGVSDWFSLDLGIEVEGERVALLPLLVQALGRLKDPSAPGAIDQLAVNGTVFVRLADGRALGLPLERTRAILNTLVELHEAGNLSADGRIKVSVGQAAALAQLEAALQVRWFGPERLLALTRRLRDFRGVQPVPPPAGFTVELRPYQRHGLDWLQFLRDFELSGILADDMGLGKTVQTLAHILVEKLAGRLDRPALVICPTSLVPNWRSEAARFAPDLRVVALHGAGRADRMSEALSADLVITTYPLLTRDAEVLEQAEWHLIVLDEAQAIKNPAAKATRVACRL
ncbi:MAG: SNF2-related protein, partial [Rhodospirillaceae bacterium]